MSAIKNILSRCVTDGAFLDHLKSQPDEALQGYDITARQREILTTRDGRLLELLGEVHNEAEGRDLDTPSGERTGSGPEGDGAVPTVSGRMSHPSRPTSMKPADIAVRLVPYASRVGDDPGSTIRLTYATHVDALPDDATMDDLPPPPVQAEYGMPLPTLAVHVSVRPFMMTVDEGEIISFEVEATVPRPPPAMEQRPAGPRVANRRSLVAAVHAASGAERMDRLMDLIDDFAFPTVDAGTPT